MEIVEVEPVPAIVAALDAWLDEDQDEGDVDGRPLGAGYDEGNVLEHEP